MMKGRLPIRSSLTDKIIIVAVVLSLAFVSFRVGQAMSPLPKSDELLEPPHGNIEGRRSVLPPGDSVLSDNHPNGENNNNMKVVGLHEPWIETKSWSPRIFVYHNILTPEECLYLIQLGKDKVTRSQVVSQTGGSAVHSARTSSGIFLTQFVNDKVVKKLAKKLADWTHLPEENGEVFYMIRYEEGQQYLPHNDYFAHDNSGEKFIGKAGQRVATVLTYLQTPEEGGETIFPNAEGGPIEVKANAGDAVLFWSVTPEGKEDPRSLHGGKPVIKGTKWAMTRWIRQRKF